MYESVSKSGPFTTRALVYSVLFHVGLFGFLWIMGLIVTRPPEVIIPIDMTVVPPWAEQTDDPNPDPNPPPPKPIEQPKPPPKPVEPPKAPDPKVEAVEKIVEKPKPKTQEKPKPKEKVDLRIGAKLINKPVPAPQPVDLRKEATKIDPPKIIKKYGSATAKDKPLSPEEFMRLMNQGYRIGAENQIAQNEVQRCLSIIQRVIQTECDKESVNWAGVQSPILDLAFGNGGRLTRYRIHTSSGDPNLDRVVLNALSRIGSIPGLSTTFLDSVKDGILLKVNAQ